MALLDDIVEILYLAEGGLDSSATVDVLPTQSACHAAKATEPVYVRRRGNGGGSRYAAPLTVCKDSNSKLHSIREGKRLSHCFY